MTDKNEMPIETIILYTSNEGLDVHNIVGSYDENWGGTGVIGADYVRKDHINAQLDEIINGIDNSLDDGDWHGIKRYLTKLKEMRGA
jgi:hypothetical protein